MQERLMRGVRALDWVLAYAGARFERPSLCVFLFHSVFADEREAAGGALLPQERLTRRAFTRFAEYLSATGHEFVAAADIAQGLPPDGRYAHVTFDDGYANNLRLLDDLRTTGVPVTLSVCTSHVLEGRAFWWDVVYRERHRQGRSAEVAAEISALHRRSRAEIEHHLRAEFGPDALRPRGELDRPLTPQELAELEREPLVTIGNHTASHMALSNRAAAEVAREVEGAQRDLEGITGTRPEVISYPHGAYDESAVDVARRHGLRVGITVDPRKDSPRPGSAELMRLGRFSVVCDNRLVKRLRRRRSEVALEPVLRRAFGRPRQWQ